MINEYELKLVNEMSISIYRRGYEMGKEDATISYQNAYNEGHVDGYTKGVDDRDSDIKSGYMNGYNKGLYDAWEAAKKIHDGQVPYVVFGLDKTGNGISYASPLNWGENISASEAIAKIKKYEEKHKCKECKWDEFRDAQSPVGTPCDSCIEGKNFSPKVARCCSILDDICPYDIKCEECEVHCSIERARKKLKEGK